MIDFKLQKENIVNYITVNYKGFLENYTISEPTITTEYIDFDKFKKDFVLFIELDSVNFNTTTFDDDCEKPQTALYNFYLVFRGDTIKNLDEKLMNASSMFYELMKETNIQGVEQTTIRTIDWFKYVEGTSNIVASKFVIEICTN